MRLIISPAKKMKVDTDSFPCHRLPAFLPQTQEILARLQRLSGQELKSLWKCSDKIALLNQQRLACMDLHRMLTPAILAYEGIQYQYLVCLTRKNWPMWKSICGFCQGFTAFCAPLMG